MALEITLTHDNGRDRARCTSFFEASVTLEEWAERASGMEQKAKIAYVLIDAKRGLFFRSSLDLGGTDAYQADLAQNVTRYLSWACGLARPASRSAEQYRIDISQFSAAMVSRAQSYLEIVTAIMNEEPGSAALEEMASAPTS